MYFDWTYLLVIAGLALSLLASAKVKSTYSKYAKVRSMSGMTGAQAAERILHANGLYDVSVESVEGELTDHYDPSEKVVRLSESVYGESSVAAVGVAAISLLGGVIQLGFTLALVPLPGVGMGGYVAGAVVSTALELGLCLRQLARSVGLKIQPFQWLTAPGLAALLAGLTGNLLFRVLRDSGLDPVPAGLSTLVFFLVLYLAALQAQGVQAREVLRLDW